MKLPRVPMHRAASATLLAAIITACGHGSVDCGVESLVPPSSSPGAPVVFYTDIVSGPASGGQDSQGAFVRLFGRGFGASRGEAQVTIGGGAAASYPLWSDSEICLQLGARAQSGDIVVTTAQGTSNAVPFTVRPGRIFFVDPSAAADPGSGSFTDPWRSPASFYSSAQAGDIAYFRGGTYAGEYGYPGWGALFGIRGGGSGASFTATGTPESPIAYLAYPGETALLHASGTGAVPGMVFRGIATDPSQEIDWLVIGNFTMEAYNECVTSETKGWRIVNNHCTGITRTTDLWAGTISPGGDGAKVLGNVVTGGRTGSKMTHAIYSAACADDIEIAWNRIYDNNFARGPMIVVNYEGARCAAGRYAGTASIHDNVIDTTTYPSRCIGVFSQSYESGDPVVPVTVLYNNVLIGCGVVDVDGTQAAVYVNNGAARIYNNSYYQTNTYALEAGQVSSAAVPFVESKYNIFHMAAGASGYFNFAAGVLTGVTAETNVYFGAAADTTPDPRPILADPGYRDAPGGDFHLRSGSMAAAVAAPSSDPVAPRDHDGVLRLADGSYDAGAFEHVVETP